MLNKMFNLINFSNQFINRFTNSYIPFQLLKLVFNIKPSLLIQKALMKLRIFHLLF